jgi:hypothetical protein
MTILSPRSYPRDTIDLVEKNTGSEAIERTIDAGGEAPAFSLREALFSLKNVIRTLPTAIRELEDK